MSENPETEKTTVVIVTEANGRERRYAADMWSPDASGWLDVHRSSRKADPIVAHYAPGAWLSVREEDAEVPDSTARALAIAKHSLNEIVQTSVTDTNADGTRHTGVAVLKELAQQGLEGIFVETEL